MSKRHELLVLLNSRRHWWQIAWVVCAADIKSLFALSCTTNMLLFMFTSRSAASLTINLHSPISIRCSISNGFYGDNSSSFVVHSRTFEFRPTHQFRAQFSNVFNSIKANLFHRWYIYSRDTIKSKVETNKRSLGAHRDRKKALCDRELQIDFLFFPTHKKQPTRLKIVRMLYEFKSSSVFNVAKSVETSINWFFKEFPHWIIARVSWRKTRDSWNRRLFWMIH